MSHTSENSEGYLNTHNRSICLFCVNSYLPPLMILTMNSPGIAAGVIGVGSATPETPTVGGRNTHLAISSSKYIATFPSLTHWNTSLQKHQNSFTPLKQTGIFCFWFSLSKSSVLRRTVAHESNPQTVLPNQLQTPLPAPFTAAAAVLCRRRISLTASDKTAD